ncbi:MAG: ribonuclease HII [Clostridia bacterium]|nr:ribonuclease HII [Clostridia bacterium]
MGKMKEEEIIRLKELSKYEEDCFNRGIELVAGIDEAGRGPLAGPVVAAAVILPKHALIEGVNDSKKISEKKREKLYDDIINTAIAWGVGIVDNNVIDEINILNATRMAMHNAIEALKVKPEYILIDAEKKVDTNGIPFMPIIKGDALSISIAAASIVAKVTRDRMMREYDEIFPVYGFEKHKGYGTKMHTEAIKEHGMCMIHRKSFLKNIIK